MDKDEDYRLQYTGCTLDDSLWGSALYVLYRRLRSSIRSMFSSICTAVLTNPPLVHWSVEPCSSVYRLCSFLCSFLPLLVHVRKAHSLSGRSARLFHRDCSTSLIDNQLLHDRTSRIAAQKQTINLLACPTTDTLPILYDNMIRRP